MHTDRPRQRGDVLVGDIMTAPVHTARSDWPLAQAARLMMRHGITALPVVDDDGGVVGILTEADLVTERLDRDPSPDRRSVQKAMTREVLTVEPTLALEAATARMLTGGRRALPVVDGRRLVGILTRRDVLAQADDPAAHPGAAPRGRALAHLRNHRFRALAEPEATDRWENDGGAILPTEP